jgi:hypothetical protein
MISSFLSGRDFRRKVLVHHVLTHGAPLGENHARTNEPVTRNLTNHRSVFCIRVM